MILPYIQRIIHDHSGTALVEFAITVPILLTMYIGGFALSDAIACNRKVTIAARSIADLTSQNTSVSTNDVNTILNASAQVMSPYASSNAVVRVSEVQVTDATHAKVIWSQAINGQPNVVGWSANLANNMAAVGSYLIFAEIQYSYTSPIGGSLFRTMTFHDNIIMSPRLSDQVTHQ